MEAINNTALKDWFKDYPNLISTNWIESMGVDLIKTLSNYGIELKFGEKIKIVRRVILMGYLLPNALERNNLIIENKTLRLRK
ncbi:MAG: hypothetical protein PHC42_01425 [Bacilli bacterium]|nr:hypothetical protein [Bacilli bacterium]